MTPIAEAERMKDADDESVDIAENENHGETICPGASNDVLGLIFETKGPSRKADALELNLTFFCISGTSTFDLRAS